MRRRPFIKTLAAASALSALSSRGDSANEAATFPEETYSMRIDPEKLRARNQNRSTVACRNGIVCSSHPLASVAGLDVLKAGGNAIDAAICANAMLHVVEPPSNGLGGDLFAILWCEKDKRLYGLNASGRSPYGWNLQKAKDLGLTKIPGNTPYAWSVPGCVSGWESLLARFGSKPLGDLLEPSIHYAREGFPVSPIIAQGWNFAPEKYPTLAEVFMPEGRPIRFGDIFRNPHLAETFEILAREGAGAFYQGEIADRIVRFSEATGGFFSKKDFENHTATWVEPATSSYRGFDVCEIPPNGQGIAVLQILNMLEPFDIPSLQPNTAEHLHLFIEAKKLAYEDRAVYYADMDHEEVPLDWLISKDYGRERSRRIDPTKASQNVLPGIPSGGSDTIYLTAADNEGNMISLIQSIYAGWGSHIVPDRLGFPIQNRGESFSLNPDDRNSLKPHKRPFHTIIPGFLTKDGAPVCAFGVMGGDFQPQGHSQVVMNMLDFEMSPQQAGDQPRVEHGGSSDPDGYRNPAGGNIRFERGFSDEVKSRLADMGHRIREGEGAFGGYQSVWREENPRRYFGGSDPRKDGCAIGY